MVVLNCFTLCEVVLRISPFIAGFGMGINENVSVILILVFVVTLTGFLVSLRRNLFLWKVL